MWIYFVLIALLVAGLLAYRRNVLRRFDEDPAQHRLAELLIGLATARRGVAESDVLALLDKTARTKANRRARVVHAVLLARKTAPPGVYAKVVELSRRLR